MSYGEWGCRSIWNRKAPGEGHLGNTIGFERMELSRLRHTWYLHSPTYQPTAADQLCSTTGKSSYVQQCWVFSLNCGHFDRRLFSPVLTEYNGIKSRRLFMLISSKTSWKETKYKRNGKKTKDFRTSNCTCCCLTIISLWFAPCEKNNTQSPPWMVLIFQADMGDKTLAWLSSAKIYLNLCNLPRP